MGWGKGIGRGRVPPSQAPTGWDGRFLAERCQRSCEGKGEGEEEEQGSSVRITSVFLTFDTK